MSATLKSKMPDQTVSVIREIAEIAKELTGVQLTERHFEMISSRLTKRLTKLNLASFQDYLVYLKRNWKDESQVLIGALTTHHTYFFREFAHYEFIMEKALKFLIPQVLARPDKTLRIWSAASSRGQEAYSIAMALQSALSKETGEAKNIKIDILGTDICVESIAIAKNGVYSWDEVKEIPLHYLSQNWTRGTGEIAHFAKAKAHLRSVCRFEQQNLLSLALKNEKPFDIVFCRNVFIYFNPTQIQSITLEIIKRMNPEGFILLGISETLNGLALPVKTVGPSIYVKNDHTWVKTPPPASTGAVMKSPVVEKAFEPEKNIRVLVVDDSPSIHTLMKQIFTPEFGFEIVGHAMNGVEASEFVKKNPVDALTLDIHMPVQDGVEYLRTNYNAKHPAVIVVSSVSREDSSLAAQAIDIGASDYVEKPALNNLKQRADEIRTKVRCAVRAKSSGERDITLDRSFQVSDKIQNPDQKLRVFLMQGSDRKRMTSILKHLISRGQPPCLLFFDAALQGAELIQSQFEKELGMRFQSEDALNATGPKPGEVYVAFHSGRVKETLQKLYSTRDVVTLVSGEVSQEASTLFHSIKSGLPQGRAWNLVLEELGARNSKHALFDVATEFSPITGFVYLSGKYFVKK